MKHLKYIVIIGFFLMFFFLIQSCNLKTNNDKITVVTTLFPLYDFTKQITQEKIEVILVLPPGVEPHSFEPKPRSIFDIRRADLFIYTGDFLEVWAKNIITVLEDERIINSSKNIDLLTEGNHHHVDPHIWVSPKNAIIMIDNIVQGLKQIDPDNQEFYQTNADNYKDKLRALDEAYLDLFNNTKYKTIIFGGHFVFGYLAKQYDIKSVSPYKGFSPDTLPTPKNIQSLINLIKTSGQKTIFYEELINPKVSKVIAEETEIKMLPLNGAGNISKDDFINEVSYLDIMYQNIENLKKGLEYNE